MKKAPRRAANSADRQGLSLTKKLPICQHGHYGCTQLVAVKLTPTELKALDQLVLFENLETRSRCLRSLLWAELDRRGLHLDARVQIKLERLRSPMRRAKRFKKEVTT